MTRRELMGWAMTLSLSRLLGKSDGKEKDKVTVVLHLNPELVEELKVAAASRNNISVEEFIVETISCAVSDPSCEPKEAVAVRLIDRSNPLPEVQICYACGHALQDNFHGLDQRDYVATGLDKFKHSGRCTECHFCYPS